MKVNIFNQSACSISSQIKDTLTALAEHTIEEENDILDGLNIIITNDSYIKELNRKFLGKNKPTNVLSFHMDEVSEIYISYDRVDRLEDLFYYVVHGLLHIIGYDHTKPAEAKKMDNKCHQYIKYITEKEQ